MQVLNNRQKQIIRLFARANTPITARKLADFFNVSLRTIRYDLDELTNWFDKNKIMFIKLPRKGMKIENKDILANILASGNMDDLHIYSIEQRKTITLLMISLASKNIYSYDLIKALDVSKTTVISTIKLLNEELKQYHIEIKGTRADGYFLLGKEQDIRSYLVENLYNRIKDNQEIFDFIKRNINYDYHKFQSIINKFLFKLNDISETNKHHLNFIILMIVIRIKSDHHLKDYPPYLSYCINSKIHTDIRFLLSQMLTDCYGKYLDNEAAYLIYLLLKFNIDKSVLINIKFNEKRLINFIDSLILNAKKFIKLYDSDTLKQELFTHLSSSIKMSMFGIYLKNPLMDDIKTKYGDIFHILENTIGLLNGFKDITINSDEIGFLTLYFVKTLEQPVSDKKKKILLVSNLSRSTSKFLATRIVNNITNIDIIGVLTSIDKNRDNNYISDADLIISTYNLTDVEKPVLIVNPIITNQELSQIRELLYIKNPIKNKKRLEIEEFKKNLFEILNTRDGMPESYTNNVELLNFFSFYSERFFSNTEILDQEVEMISMILLEILEMISGMESVKHSRNYLKTVSGIFIHIVTSVPRWQRGEFIYDNNYEYYKENYYADLTTIELTLEKINKKFHLSVPNTESTSILRYTLD